MSKVDSFHSYLRATKDMAQSVVHRYHTCDDEPNVAWEIIEDIMEGLIAVFLDMFGKEENPTHKNLTESDMERDIDSLEERVDEFEKRVERFRYETVEKIKALDGKIEALEREVSDQRKIINNLDFKNGEYDAQINNLTDEQNNLGIRLSLAEKKVRVLAQHCNVIFTE